MPRELNDTYGHSRSAEPASTLVVACLVNQQVTQPICQAGHKGSITSARSSAPAQVKSMISR